MNEKQLQWLAYGLVVMAIVVAGFLGVRYPIPEPPPEISPMLPEWEEETSFGVGARYTPFGSVRVQHELNVVGAADFDSTLNVDGAATLASVTATGAGDFDSTLNVDGAMTLVGDMTCSALVDVGTFLNLSEQTAISVTAGAILTPTGTYQPLTSAAAVTTSTSCAVYTGTTGNVVIFVNENASDIITIDGTGGNVECKSDQALGSGDSLMMMWDGLDWQCLSDHDNS